MTEPYRYIDDDQFCLSARLLPDLDNGGVTDILSITIEGSDEPQSIHVRAADAPVVAAGIVRAAGQQPAVVSPPAVDQTAPDCKDDEGCHRVVACNPGCAVTTAHMQAQLAAAAGGRADTLRQLADQQTQLAIGDDLERRRYMAAARRQLVKELRRLAGEAEQPERPRCPHCQLPHDLTPGGLTEAACQSIRARIAEAKQRHAEGDHVGCAAVDCETARARMEAPQNRTPDGETPAVVAYQSRDGRQLRCLLHAPSPELVGPDWTPRTGLDIDGDASNCTETRCGRDVLAELPPCSAGLLPTGSGPVDPCIVKEQHDEHVTAEGRRWSDEAST